MRYRDGPRRLVDPALAVFTALLLGGLLIVVTDFEHLRLLGTDPRADEGEAGRPGKGGELGRQASSGGASGGPGTG